MVLVSRYINVPLCTSLYVNFQEFSSDMLINRNDSYKLRILRRSPETKKEPRIDPLADVTFPVSFFLTYTHERNGLYESANIPKSFKTKKEPCVVSSRNVIHISKSFPLDTGSRLNCLHESVR